MLNKIPSKDVREYMMKNDRRFTDAEKATVAYHLDVGLMDKHDMLMDIAEHTDDLVLKQQIRERIAYDRKALSIFDTGGQKVFYALLFRNGGEWHPGGYFDSVKNAQQKAIRRQVEYRIEKHKIHSKNDDDVCAVRMNPRIFSEPGQQVGEIESNGQPLSEARFDASGNIRSLITNEMPSSETDLVDDWGATRFEERYIDIPNPFERGDIVCVTDSRRVGVVETSRKDWEAFNTEIAERALPVDWSDAAVTVSFLDERGAFSHDHICPLFLERAELDESEPKTKLLEAASALLTGTGSLEMFSSAHRCLVGSVHFTAECL